MKKYSPLGISVLSLLLLSACKSDEKSNTNTVDDGAAKSEVTETGQHVGSTTDSTSAVSDEPNPSND